MSESSSTPAESPQSGPLQEAEGGKPSSRRRRMLRPLLFVAIGGILFAAVAIWRDSDGLTALRCLSYGDTQPLPRDTQPLPRIDPFEAFALTDLTIPKQEIRRGAPKGGIPVLTDAEFVAAAATFLSAEDAVIGVVFDGSARAFPLKILDRHEIVNDRIGNHSFAVTYCPLCDSSVVFDRQTPAGELEFGVSGLLYNSNVLMYNRLKNEPESLWSQMMTQAVSGPLAKRSLKTLPLEVTTWSDGKSSHPETSVLSKETGYQRDYSIRAYQHYFDSPDLMASFRPSIEIDNRLPLKERVLEVWTGNAGRAYPLTAFKGLAGTKNFDDELDGKKLTLAYNADADSLRVVHADDGLQWLYAFWFAWYAFHPDTDLFETPADK